MKSKLQSPQQADRHRKPTNAVAKRLGRQIGAYGKCTRVGPNFWDLAIGNWNVSSLTGKEQELVCEAQQYRLHIEGILSPKRRSSNTVDLNGGWKIYYSGVDAAMSTQAGVNLLVCFNMAECVVDWVPLRGKVCLLKLRLQKRLGCRSATNCCGRKRVERTKSREKRTPWWNQEVKEAIQTKKVDYKARLANKSSLEFRSQYSEARKAATIKGKLFKERAWKEFEERLDDFKMANKVFWQTIRVEKNLKPLSSSKVQMASL